jgi:hypothetical protein
MSLTVSRIVRSVPPITKRITRPIFSNIAQKQRHEAGHGLLRTVTEKPPVRLAGVPGNANLP